MNSVGGEDERAVSVAAQYPRDRVNLNQIGRILFLKRQYADAVGWFKRTTAIDPEDVTAHYNLMLCYRGLNESELSAVEEILMIGYPNGLWDAVNNYPLIRRGVTASHPAVDFDVDVLVGFRCIFTKEADRLIARPAHRMHARIDH